MSRTCSNLAGQGDASEATSVIDTAGLLEGRGAIVSGVGPGMGRAIALELARAGAGVALAARRPGSMEPVADELHASGATVVSVPTDVSDPAACARLADTAAGALGRVDILVNNAFAEEDWRDPFHGFDPDRWRRPVDVNVFGTLQLTQACVPHLERAATEHGDASVVMITTLSVKNPIPMLAGYAASKRALTTAAQVLAKELGPAKVRVNCVAPGHIRGRSLDEYFEWIAAQRGVTPGEVADEIAAMNPLHHLADPEEIAPAVLFFASSLSKVVTGQTLDVNCGRTMG
jgi:NAD(P)-dependent dehydrogenase (short-subunit alcohol dehydrogenase family)